MIHSDHIGKAWKVSLQTFDISSASEHHFLKASTENASDDCLSLQECLCLREFDRNDMTHYVFTEVVSVIQSINFQEGTQLVIRNGGRTKTMEKFPKQ